MSRKSRSSLEEPHSGVVEPQLRLERNDAAFKVVVVPLLQLPRQVVMTAKPLQLKTLSSFPYKTRAQSSARRHCRQKIYLSGRRSEMGW